jgi:TPR repeat protein
MLVKYCSAECQNKHWPKHKKECKLRAAEIYDEALFKDPPAKEDCPICFLPMPVKLISCISLPPATILSVPIYDFAQANQKLVKKATEQYYVCCGKSVCAGCIHSCYESGNFGKCPFCNAERMSKTEDELLGEIMKRVEANDAGALNLLGNHHYNGLREFQQDVEKAIELQTQAAELGSSDAHFALGLHYHKGGDMKKANVHLGAAAMAGCEAARYNLGRIEANNGNFERAFKHWTIAASAGCFDSMHELIVFYEKGLRLGYSFVSRESIDSILTAYNNSCAEMRSEARDAYIRCVKETI